MTLGVMFVDQIVTNLRISILEVKENTTYVGQLEKHFSKVTGNKKIRHQLCTITSFVSPFQSLNIQLVCPKGSLMKLKKPYSD